MSEWHPIETAPQKTAIMTKIDDDKGERNVQALSRSKNMWFVPDGGMYVYYRPTHWRHLTDAERDDAAALLHQQKRNYEASYARALNRLYKA